jgi:hypothetical protein
MYIKITATDNYDNSQSTTAVRIQIVETTGNFLTCDTDFLSLKIPSNGNLQTLNTVAELSYSIARKTFNKEKETKRRWLPFRISISMKQSLINIGSILLYQILSQSCIFTP